MPLNETILDLIAERQDQIIVNHNGESFSVTFDDLIAEIKISRQKSEKIKNLAVELSVMNRSLLNHSGDLQEKSLHNFMGEFKRIISELIRISFS